MAKYNIEPIKTWEEIAAKRLRGNNQTSYPIFLGEIEDFVGPLLFNCNTSEEVREIRNKYYANVGDKELYDDLWLRLVRKYFKRRG